MRMKKSTEEEKGLLPNKGGKIFWKLLQAKYQKFMKRKNQRQNDKKQ